ncbi:hypothetical protein OIU74_014014 [Salix koriyanagi]|uniref:Uncharacterized protein n=1 Tax=Salix koriyanagi TaxID=2511006 RepID=A0A9Q0SYW4_9ROSI|nr:hypothetical protein OIU74_014014 [Salix koriyanagi]
MEENLRKPQLGFSGMFKSKIGTGANTSLWFDPWLPRCHRDSSALWNSINFQPLGSIGLDHPNGSGIARAILTLLQLWDFIRRSGGFTLMPSDNPVSVAYSKALLHFMVWAMRGAQPKGFQQHAQSGEYAQGRGCADYKNVAAQPKQPDAANSAV